MRVAFPLKKIEGSNMIEYPDKISFFGNTEIVDNSVIADYWGKLVLDPYIPKVIKTPEEEAKEIVALVKTEELDKTDLGLAVKALLTERGLI